MDTNSNKNGKTSTMLRKEKTMAQLPRETDEMENQKTQEVLILDNCVIINIRDYDTLTYQTKVMSLFSMKKAKSVNEFALVVDTEQALKVLGKERF